MLRVLKTKFRASKADLDRLFACNRASAQVWTDCLEFSKKHHQETGQWITRMDLHHATKRRYPLHSQSIQSVFERYLTARENAYRAHQKGHRHIRYPYKKKRHFNTRWKKDGFCILDDGRIVLKLGLAKGKRQKPMVVRVKNLPPGQIKEIEFLYDRGPWLAISYDDGLESPPKEVGSTIAVDLGEIHSLAAVSDKGQVLLITGRKIRSIKRLRNKKQKELQKKMSRCQKGSRQWKRYRWALTYLLSKSDAQLKDALHKTTRAFVGWCGETRAKVVVVGDVEGIQRNTSAKRKKNPQEKRRSASVAQKLSQWQFGRLYRYLEYKLKAIGVNVHKIDEAYTSQTCPVCGKRRKVSSRWYKCSCGYEEHRDIHGAKNILALYKHGEIRDMGPVKSKYLRIA